MKNKTQKAYFAALYPNGRLGKGVAIKFKNAGERFLWVLKGALSSTQANYRELISPFHPLVTGKGGSTYLSA